MKFTFRLEGVLEQRKHVERQCQRNVASAQQNLLGVQAELDALVAVRRTSSAELRSGRLSVAALAAHQRFALATRAKATTLRQRIADARRELEHAHSVLVEAAKQRRIMEKLRDRERVRWAESMRKREDRESEESARTAHHARI